MNNPFKPGSGLFPPYFADRKREMDIFNNKLDQTISGSPMHMAIIGDWAMGKTSLLRQLTKSAEERNLFSCMIICPVTDSLDAFVDSISESISDELKRTGKKNLRNKIVKSLSSVDNVGISAFGFGAQAHKRQKSTTPQFALRIGLRTVWDYLSDKHDGMVLLIDDIDLVSKDQEKTNDIMLTLRNALMEAINDDVRIMCVVSGTSLFKHVESMHGPLVRFFEPFELTNLTESEAKKAIEIPLEGTGVEFDRTTIDKILATTNYHPYYLQEFCYFLFENARNGVVNADTFDSLYNGIMHDLSRKMWTQRIDELGDVSLFLISNIANGLNTSEALMKEGKKNKIQPNTLRSTLTRLNNNGHLIRIGRGKYELNDPLFGKYVSTIYMEKR